MSHENEATRTGDGGDAWRQTSSDDVLDTAARVREGLSQETTGWDDDELAAVVLDRLGTPTRVLVTAGWASRATPERLAAAVVDASLAAARDLDEQARVALQQDAAARRARWAASRSASAPADARATPTSDPSTPRPAGPPAAAAAPATARRRPEPTRDRGELHQPRPLDELAELAISSLAAASHASAADAATTRGVGRELDGDVEVTVGRGGVVAVALRGPRVAVASAATLSRLLTSALGAAVQDLARQAAHEAPAVSDELLAEVLAHLRALTADPLSSSGGHVAPERA